MHLKWIHAIVLGMLLSLTFILGGNAEAAERLLFLGDRESGGAVHYYLDTQASKMTGSDTAQVVIVDRAAQMPGMGGTVTYIYNFADRTAQCVHSATLANGKVVYQQAESGSAEDASSDFYFYDKIYAFFHNGAAPGNDRSGANNGEGQESSGGAGQGAGVLPDLQHSNKFPATWNGLQLRLNGTMPEKFSQDLTFLRDEPIRGIIINHPRTHSSDNGSLRFNLDNDRGMMININNGQISVSYSYDQENFGGRPLRKGSQLYTYYYYTGYVAMYVPGDGHLYVDFVVDHTGDRKSFVYDLPEDAHYFNGSVWENALIGEVAFYK